MNYSELEYILGCKHYNMKILFYVISVFFSWSTTVFSLVFILLVLVFYVVKSQLIRIFTVLFKDQESWGPYSKMFSNLCLQHYLYNHSEDVSFTACYQHLTQTELWSTSHKSHLVVGQIFEMCIKKHEWRFCGVHGNLNPENIYIDKLINWAKWKSLGLKSTFC